jgi:hypothetical protein
MFSFVLYLFFLSKVVIEGRKSEFLHLIRIEGFL